MPFIVFEGLDACGKSTQMKLLERRLEEAGVSFIETREPGGTPLGEELRTMVLKIGSDAPVPRSELLIYEASRAQLVETVIKPALEKKQWVICDRFAASSVAFQSAGRQLKKEDIDWLNNFATGGLQADLTVLVDVSVVESERRKNDREQTSGQEQDRFESEKRHFHQAVYDSYQEQLKSGQDWLRVDGEKSIEEVFRQLWQEVERRKWLES